MASKVSLMHRIITIKYIDIVKVLKQKINSNIASISPANVSDDCLLSDFNS